MSTLWAVTRAEVLRIVRQRTYLFFAIGMPLLIILFSSFPIIIETLRDENALGVLDPAAILSGVSLETSEETRVILFEDAAEGRAALDAGAILSLWTLPPDYPQSGRLEVTIKGDGPSSSERRALAVVLRRVLLDDAPEGVAERLAEPADLTYLTLDTGRRVRQGIGLVMALLIPFGMGAAFSFAIAFSSGYMAQAVSEEKENRLIEILITSIPVRTLLAGKILGLTLVALLKIAFWIVALLVVVMGFFLSGRLPEGLPIPWDLMLAALPFFLVAFLLYATLLVGLRVVIGETQATQQVSGMIGLVAWLPIWFIPVLLDDPSGVVARVLTLFPITAPIMIPARMALGRVAPAEILLSFLILVLTFLAALWAVSRLFEVTVLRYGTRMTLGDLLGTLRPAGRPGGSR